MGRFCFVTVMFLGPTCCCFFLLGKTNSYHSNSFSLPIVPYTFLSHLVMSSSCSSGLNFDGQIVSNRGQFQSHCQNFSMEFSKNTHSRNVPRLKQKHMEDLEEHSLSLCSICCAALPVQGTFLG